LTAFAAEASVGMVLRAAVVTFHAALLSDPCMADYVASRAPDVSDREDGISIT